MCLFIVPLVLILLHILCLAPKNEDALAEEIPKKEEEEKKEEVKEDNPETEADKSGDSKDEGETKKEEGDAKSEQEPAAAITVEATIETEG